MVIADVQKRFCKAAVDSIRRDLEVVLDVVGSSSVQASSKTLILSSMPVLAHPVMAELLADRESRYDQREKQFCGIPNWNVWVSGVSDILRKPDCGLTIEAILGECGGDSVALSSGSGGGGGRGGGGRGGMSEDGPNVSAALSGPDPGGSQARSGPDPGGSLALSGPGPDGSGDGGSAQLQLPQTERLPVTVGVGRGVVRGSYTKTPHQILTVAQILHGDPVAHQLPRFAAPRLRKVFDHVIRTDFGPRNAKLRGAHANQGERMAIGSCKRDHNASCFEIPTKQYCPSDPRPNTGGAMIVQPLPDDYAFAGCKMYLFDFADTYGVVVKCVNCEKERQTAAEEEDQLDEEKWFKKDSNHLVRGERLSQGCWTHQADKTWSKVHGCWLIATQDSLYNYATARVRICRDCNHQQHDFMSEVWWQLPDDVKADLPLHPSAVQPASKMFLERKLERNLLFSASSGGAFQTFADWMATEFAISDDLNSQKYYLDINAWQSDMEVHNLPILAHLSYFHESVRSSRTVPNCWGYDLLINALQTALRPQMALLQQDGVDRDPMDVANGSFPMQGLTNLEWMGRDAALPAPDDPDYWLYLCLDHNYRTGKKVGSKMVWNVTNAKTKELMFQRFTDTTASADWLPYLRAVAQTPYCRNRIKIVFMDNVTGDVDDVNTLAGQVAEATGAEFVKQDIWHVENNVTSKANNRCVHLSLGPSCP